MGKARAWLHSHRPTRRRLIQVYAALLYNAHLKGFIEGDIYTGPLKNLCVPGLNCYSCPGAIGACPLGALQNALASSGNRAPWYVLGILLLLGLTLGRTICGWLCPVGMLQELLHKLPTPKLPKSRFTRALSWVKYGILAVFALGIPLASIARGLPVPAFCKYICPAGTLEGAVGLLANPVNASRRSLLGALFARKLVILLLVLAACVFIYRAFCRFLCPLGAIYGLFARLSLLGVKVEAPKCTDCGRCVSRCRMDIRRVGDHECIHCGECVSSCPTQAIQWKTGAARAVPKRRGIAWICALLVLGGALWACNQPGAAVPAEAAVGAEVGMRCPDFTVPLYAGGDFTLSEAKGRVVVLNFWATWCAPCVSELPHFQRLQDSFGDDLALVAIHSSLVTDDVRAFLDASGLSLPFALDTDGSVISALGGSTMLPMTVVVDRSGSIVYNQVGSVTYEQLESLVAPLL